MGNAQAPVTVYVGAKVRTLDDRASVRSPTPLPEAVAVSGDSIVAVGTRAEVLQGCVGARVVELPGATLVPGLNDAHAHLASLGRSLTIVSLNGTRSVAEVVERAKAASPESQQGDWWVGRGWDQNDWKDGGGAFPDKRALDEAFPRAPVFLTRVDGHAAWLNSAALQRAGISRTTPDPAGGRIVRDSKGEPTGILVDNAIDLVSGKMPPISDEQRAARLSKALAHCARVGLTTIHDAGMDAATFKLLQQWDFEGKLPLRVYAMADGQGDDWQTWAERGTFKGRMLSLRAVKLLADGALGSRGAALHEPYSDDPTQRGLLLLEPEVLRARAKAFMAAGFQVAVHAIGDRANSLVLDVLAQEAQATGTRALRHRVEHAQILRVEDIPRFARDGLIASMQPTHATSDMPWAPARLGPARLAGAYAWKSVLDSGAALAFGSDFPIEDPDPRLGLYSARTRQDAAGQPAGGWQPQERLTGDEALRAFTVGAAFASHAETERGRLVPGMQADFVALSVDPVDDAPTALLSAKVMLSVVAGREVHPGPGPRH
jgi:predicted amidohydrolase YtcJ